MGAGRGLSWEQTELGMSGDRRLSLYGGAEQRCRCRPSWPAAVVRPIAVQRRVKGAAKVVERECAPLLRRGRRRRAVTGKEARAKEGITLALIPFVGTGLPWELCAQRERVK